MPVQSRNRRQESRSTRDRRRRRALILERCEGRVLMTTYGFTTATSISVVDGPTAATGQITSNEVGPISFAASDNPSITDSSNLATTLVIDNPTRPTGLTTLNANLFGGNNTVTITASSASYMTNVTTGGGDDSYNVTLSGIESLVSKVDGGGGSNTLTINAGNLTLYYPLSPGRLIFVASGGVTQTLNYANFAHVTIETAMGPTILGNRTITGIERQGLVDAVTTTFTSYDENATASDFRALIDWGDSATNPNYRSAGTITQDSNAFPGVFYVTGSHVYEDPFYYPISTFVTAPLSKTTVVPTPAPPSVSILGSARSFAVLGGSTITNAGATVLSGDVGVSPGIAVAGFPPGTVTGGAIHPDDLQAVRAQADLATAYATVAGEAFPAGNDLSGKDLGGLTLTPGVYHFDASAQLTGQLVLDGRGDSNARFDIQVGGSLATAPAASILLINGANPDNVYFQVGDSATLGANTSFQGNILANNGITLGSGARFGVGRALAIHGAVSLDTDAVTAPPTPPAIVDVPVTITNVPPFPTTSTGLATAIIARSALLATASPFAATQGQATPANLVIATFTDTGGAQALTQYSATIDFGDGSPVVAGTVAASESNFQVLAPAHTYLAGGLDNVTVRVTKGPEFFPETVVAVGQASVAAVAPALAAGPALGGVEGTPFNGLVATFTSVDPAATIGDFSATIDWGDGTRSPGVISQAGGAGTAFRIDGGHTYAQASRLQPYLVTVALAGPGSTRATATVPANIADAPLTGTSGVAVDATEGAPLIGVPVARFADGNPLATISDFTATIDWGDGTPVDASAVVQATGGANFRILGDHTYATPGRFPIRVAIDDKGGSTLAVAAQATVASATLTGVQGATFVAVDGLPATGVVATFAVPNVAAIAAEFAGTAIDWGDGTTSPGVVTRSGSPTGGSSFVVTGTHTYAEVGNVPIRVTIASSGGGTAVASSLAIVSAAPIAASALPVAATEGTPLVDVPVATFTDANPGATSGDFSATIDWGDGTPATTGAISEADSTFTVRGSHTYADAHANAASGAFTITTRIASQGGSTATATGTATVSAVPMSLVGRLNPYSDSGLSDVDGITNVARPSFVGNSNPLATITLGAMPLGGGPTVLLGSTTTDAGGAWSLTSTISLADGSYTVLVLATDRSGSATALEVVAEGSGGGPLVIDTVGPKVADLAFDRLRGRVTATLLDERSGLDQATVIDGANFLFGLVHPLPGHAAKNLAAGYRITGLRTSPQVDPVAPQVVVGTVNRGQAIPGGFYRLTILSGGIEDVAGNALDGEFYGYFPSGNNRPGGNFVADLNGVHTVTLPPLPDGSSASPLISPGRRPTATVVPALASARIASQTPVQQILDEPGQAVPSPTATVAAKKSAAKSTATSLRDHDSALARVVSG